MKRRIQSDRNDTTAQDDKQKGEKRNHKKRKFVRLVYPPFEGPKILNANFRIADISQHGIQFVCKEDCKDCKNPISLKSIVDLKIQFHDEKRIDIKVEILRCERTLHSQEKVYSGYVEKGITTERIAKEQAYLLSHFPDYCRLISE